MQNFTSTVISALSNGAIIYPNKYGGEVYKIILYCHYVEGRAIGMRAALYSIAQQDSQGNSSYSKGKEI
ncbi:hypothetical protein KHA93_05445 [Bacillus sp. FJAT-49732]|uniref:Uncharacterized protein n=1 Tax=Lederbergia citrisecunda TaxID=2833583 RepID=A0A942YM94_9BACI|nr:hypothetical protein [Lederbergia citrisecunda]MBS4199101.1 hypothetical protein [Lederbergia citrisecunda]